MEPILQVQNLSKSYAGNPALKNFTAAIGRGEVFGLLGPNGAGKTTAVECIVGTKRPDSGTVSILGMNPVKDRRTLFERVGVQFQEAAYQDKITVGELCEVTRSLYRAPASAEDLLKRFGLQDKAKSPVNELSGGLKQRLFVVLALIPAPEVVFLDELTTGLDVKARRDIWNYLSGLKSAGLTVFLTSHSMEEVEALCDKICILKNGETVFSGTAAEAIEASPRKKLEDAYLWFTGEEDDDHESL